MSQERPGLLVIERILRDRQSIWQQIVEERDLNSLTGQMLASSAIALACYGAVLGAFHSFLMALTSAVKLPLLFLVTLAICLPTLYLFNLVFGARLSVRQAISMVVVAITVTSMLAVAFAPISLFFLITAPDYAFFKLLNVAILTLSALVGLRFLTAGMQVLNAHGLLAPAPAAAGQPAVPPAAVVPAQGNVWVAPQQVAPQQVATPQPVPVAVGAVNGEAPAPATTANGDGPTPVAPAPAQPAVATPAPVEGSAPAPAQVTAAPVPVAPAPAQVGPAQLQPVPGQFAPQYAGYRPLDQHPIGRPGVPQSPSNGPRPASMTLLYIWILLFGFVGTQLAWTLRPFFGSPHQPFAFFRSIDGNFYAEILRSLGSLF